MPHINRPRRGSLQYWPRKRAKRIYPRISHWPHSTEAKPLGFAGWKAGMTHVQITDNDQNSSTFGKIITKTATVLDAAPLFVCAVRFYKESKCISEKWSEKLPKHIELKIGKGKRLGSEPNVHDRVTLIVSTQPEKSGMKKMKPELFEIAIGGEPDKQRHAALAMLGKELGAEEIFKPGDFIDVAAITKGFGFQGPVKRFGIRIQTRKDQQHHRHVGSIGSTVPRKVDWRVPAAGQHGFHKRTEYNKRVMMISNEPKKIIPKGGFVGYGNPSHFILLEGSVPGPNKRLIRLRKSVRAHNPRPVDIKYISLESKQGV